MLNRISVFLTPGLLYFSAAGFFALFLSLYALFGLPSPYELSVLGQKLYESYGLLALCIAAMMEGLFMVNIYIPGSFVIVLSVYLSDKTPSSLLSIALITWCGFFISSVINYILGATGGYRALLFLGKKGALEKMRAWMERNGSRAMFLSAIHPNFQAFVMVSSGITRQPVARTLAASAISLAFWVPLWTVFFSIILKSVAIDDSDNSWYVVALLVMVGLIVCSFEWLKKKRREKSQ